MKKNYRGRRRNPMPLIAGVILVVGLGLVLWLKGVLPLDKPGVTQPEEPGLSDPVDVEDPNPANPDPENPGGNEQTPDPEPPVDPTPDPEPYPTIVLEGEEEQYDALYRIGDTGFEMYTYVPEVGEKYAQAVNAVADALQGTADVYALTVPLSSGITLPDDKQGGIFGNQKSAEERIASLLDDNVRPVSLYDTLMRHRDEYIYYRTDHHWSALGAYYAYRCFCEAKGVTPHELSDYWMEEFPGFLGSFYRDSDENEAMGENPDTMVVYHPVTKTAFLDFTDTRGDTIRWKIIFDVSDYDADMKYNTFIGGDNPYTIITNPEVTEPSSCVVVKESFGNALVPYLVDHYQTVYVLDYRYWQGDLTDFVREQGVQDVLFVNNLSAIRSSYLMGKLQDIL